MRGEPKRFADFAVQIDRKVVGCTYELRSQSTSRSRLSSHARRTGQDVLHLIQIAVTRFVEQELLIPSDDEWTEELNERRCKLIDKDLVGQISVAERIELVSLQKRAESYFDRVAPPEMETVTRLHKELLSRTDSGNGSH